MKCGSRCLLKQRFHVNLVNQHAGAGASGDLANLFQCREINEDSAWVMKICQDNQFRVGSDQRIQLFQRHLKTVFETTLKTFHLGAQVSQQGNYRLVSRLLDQYLVTGFEKRSQRQMIGERRSGSSDNRVNSNSIPRGNRVD
jgi:hypothetical protein